MHLKIQNKNYEIGEMSRMNDIKVHFSILPDDIVELINIQFILTSFIDEI